ncbi:MAG TPA: bifunctional hydroxymethylpyrimidine kinase/phosphomethylpyrimidine kinase [Pyrinomonadaceae bacterium]|nr:bifunctional hydroxymethylpyrimidine kinase/phosphomethylpyrimidine kinase [Pyrinomonadaceae bacterium]
MNLDTSKPPPVCLTIAGLDPSGGAGIIADIKTFSAFGCFAAAAVSSVTFQNTTGVFGAVHQTADSVRRQVDPVLDDYQVAAVKTGMLPTREIIEEVARLIESRKLRNIVVDPVVRSTSGFDLIDDAALAAVIEKLFRVAHIITPNLAEAERITRMAIRSDSDIQKAARIMRAQGARNVLIKGGHLFDAAAKPRMARDYLFMGDEPTVFEAEFVETSATHGTGCTLAAAIAANLALGKELVEAVARSKRFVTEAIRTAPMLGKGNSPINV